MSKSQIGNTELISTLNNRLVLQAVRVMQPTFRAEVARKTGLKPATVTSIVNNLIDKRLLREVRAPAGAATGADASGRFGRPPLMLEVNPDAKRVLAIDLEPDRIRVASSDLLANLLNYREESINRFERPEPVLDKIVELARDVLGTTNRKQLLGVGVSLPGMIDPAEGVLIGSTNMPKWKDVPVGTMLEKQLKAPVRVERSVHLAALYEKWSNVHHQDRTVVMISLRTGIGMSLLHRGQLYAGANGLSGEIGHCIVDINGKPCECGSRGCLETFVSASAICERGKALMKTARGKALQQRVDRGEPLTPELMYGLARDGDPGCADIVRDVGRYIGIAIGNTINLLAPDEIVICGAIDMADDLILEAVRQQVNESALPRSREKVTVRLANEREKLPLLGAAVLIAQDIFELPELRHADIAGKGLHEAISPASPAVAAS